MGIEVQKLDKDLWCIKSQRNPLSSDAFLYKDEDKYWIFDVGERKENADYINALEGPKNLVVSHFHRDHTAGFSWINSIDKLFVTAYSRKRIDVTGISISEGIYEVTEPIMPDSLSWNSGKVIQSAFLSGDSRNLSQTVGNVRIIPMPSSHSKGCLAMEIAGRYLFLGDSLYGRIESENRSVYNVQLVKSQMEVLKKSTAPICICSHRNGKLMPRESAIAFLESVYLKREEGSPYIRVRCV